MRCTQIKGLVDQLKVKPMNATDREKLVGTEANVLAQILEDVLSGEDSPTQVRLWAASSCTPPRPT